VAKAVSTETATLTPGSSRTSGASFLDILMNGVGVGGQVTQAASAQKQSSSPANPTNRSNQDDETPQSATFAAEVSASTPTESSAQGQKLHQPDPETAGNSQATNPSASDNPAAPLDPAANPLPPNIAVSGWIGQNLNASETAVASSVQVASSRQAAPPSGKSSNAPQAGHGKPAVTPPADPTKAELPTGTVPVPVQLERFASLAPASSEGQELWTAATRSDLPATNPPTGPEEQNAHGAQSSPEHTSPPTLEGALTILPATSAGVLNSAGKTTASSAQDSRTSGPNDGQDLSNGPALGSRASSPGFTVSSSPSPMNTFLSATLVPDGFGLPQSVAQSFNASGNTSTLSQNANSFNATPGVAGTSTATTSAKSNGQDLARQNGQGSSQGAQSPQSDASQVTNATGKDGLSVVQQLVPLGSSAPVHETAVAHAPVSASGEGGARSTAEPAPTGADSANLPAALTSSAINSARVIQSINETEMRVGMRSSEFGDISIRTMVSQQQVQAQISVDHGELSGAISAHIPSIQAKFGSELGLHATIEVNQSGMSFSGERGQSAPREQRSFVPSGQPDRSSLPAETQSLAVRAAPVTVDDSRLDIRA
jgi:hypothetical protein